MSNEAKNTDYKLQNNEFIGSIKFNKRDYDLNIQNQVLLKFPSLNKSKAPLLHHFKIKRELDLFTKSYDIYSIPVRKLRKIIQKWDRSLEKNPFILLTQLQHDVLMETLLGDGTLRKRKLSCFRGSHSEKQEKYLLWKYNLFKDFIRAKIHTRKFLYRKNMYSFDTLSHNVFNYYYNLFYKNGKKIITKEILEKLNPLSIAIWICDDGSYCNKQGNITLCTNAFSLEEHKLIKEYFNEKWNLDPTIGFRDKKYYYLRFKKQDSIKLINIIKNFIPIKEMFYKIGEKNGY